MMCMSQSTNRSPSFMASSSVLIRRIEAVQAPDQSRPHARALARGGDGAVNHEASRVHLEGRIVDLLPLEVDLHQARGRDLVEEDAVRVDEEFVLGSRHA